MLVYTRKHIPNQHVFLYLNERKQMAKRTEDNKGLVLHKNSVWNFWEGSMNVFQNNQASFEKNVERKKETNRT